MIRIQHWAGNFILILALGIVCAGCSKDDPVPSVQFDSLEEEINYIAEKYVKVGAVVGIINKDHEKQIFSFGKKSLNDTLPPDANSIFDIGSITKTFTTTLYADMKVKGLIPNDKAAYYLPMGEVSLPTYEGTEITLTHLATHTSGLPRTPHTDNSDYPPPVGYDVSNPYAAYTTELVYDYFTNYCTLLFEPGTWWEYSNTATGLLGHILGLIDGTSYESILTRQVFNILAMDHSSLFITDEQKEYLAPGYNQQYTEVPYFVANDIFQACGMIKSSMNDMFKYLEANMGIVETPLNDAMGLAHQTVMHQGSMGDQGLAWFILELDDGQKIIYTGGDTHGHSAYLGFNKENKTGAIILLNHAAHGSQLNMGPEILKAIIKY